MTLTDRDTKPESGEPEIHEDEIIKWVPIVVPLLAVLLVLGVIFIEAQVLA